jgi:hypothetical protein
MTCTGPSVPGDRMASDDVSRAACRYLMFTAQPTTASPWPDLWPAAECRSGSGPPLSGVIGYLRERKITPTYDPAAGILHAETTSAAQTITVKSKPTEALWT